MLLWSMLELAALAGPADWHDMTRCWDGHEADAQSGEPWRPVYTGEMPGCVTPDGVYDLTGNVEEWVGETPEKAMLLGGAFDTSEDHARCYRRNDTFGAGYKALRTGFRCCSN
jgi:formylglycine-generating enzyme